VKKGPIIGVVERSAICS